VHYFALAVQVVHPLYVLGSLPEIGHRVVSGKLMGFLCSAQVEYLYLSVNLRIFICLLLLLVGLTTQATHIRSADIRLEPICGNPFQFRISVIAYLNTQSNTRFGTNSEVLFGDGTSVRIPLTTATLRPDLGLQIAVATFSTVHTYPGNGTYTISYVERDRSRGILNIANSEDVPYVTFIQFTISAENRCNQFPILAVPPLDRACFRSAFYHSSGAYDTDGDSLSYELSVPAASPTTLANYTAPNNTRFYTNFNQGNEAASGPPVFKIDPLDGLVTWDAPGAVGEYNIAFKIVEWRKDPITQLYRKLSTTTRDMQIVVEECRNQRPSLLTPTDLCVEAGTPIDRLIFGTDGDNHDVKIEVFSEVLNLPATRSPATFSPPPAFMSSVPQAEVRFRWNTTCRHVRQQPYAVVFKITDNPPQGPRLVNFKIWNIKVVAPAPVWQNSQLDVVNRHGALAWQPYTCEGADKIQIWRKVGSVALPLNRCQPGLPRFAGYQLISEVDIAQSNFTDTNFGRGLVAGATYCYRLVAYFNPPAGTPSMASTEICLGPIGADAPVITHVSIEKTDSLQGRTRISWRSPFTINRTQFPPPYQYEVYRASGFASDSLLSRVARVSDTTCVDATTNTAQRVFNYRVVVYARPVAATGWIPVDTSAAASSVRLRYRVAVRQIELAWRDSVPWSNVAAARPYHLIYRGIETADPASMELIDSVQVAENGFTYFDRGQYRNQPLEEDLRYAYRVETRGTYGNPAIALQKNFSQVIYTYPKNNLLPCVPKVRVATIPCEEYLQQDNCKARTFSNTLSWTVEGLRGCRKDIRHYSVFASADGKQPFSLLQTSVRDTVFIDSGLPSFVRCYRVTAHDFAGVESAASDSVCNDNCPYYELPNVFTPNNDGWNETFSAEFDAVPGQSNAAVVVRCPRFVRSVELVVYNRWGQPVFEFATSDPDGQPLVWDGRDQRGQAVNPGIYFYQANVRFVTLQPGDEARQLWGWVHVVR
jgi:hypothetical protein